MAVQVVLIDDDMALRMLASRWLQRAGFEVTACEDADDAFDALDELDHDTPIVVLLDLHLEDESGFDVMPRLFERWPTLRVVLMTAEDDPEILAESTALGAIGHLPKPVTQESAARAVREAAEHP